jgi:hypothetical protein
MSENISPEDFIHSFVKAATKQGIQVSVIYTYTKVDLLTSKPKEVMKMTGNGGPEQTLRTLQMIDAQVKRAAAQVESTGDGGVS